MPGNVLVDSSFFIARLRHGEDPLMELAEFSDEYDFVTCGPVLVEVRAESQKLLACPILPHKANNALVAEATVNRGVIGAGAMTGGNSVSARRIADSDRFEAERIEMAKQGAFEFEQPRCDVLDAD